MSNTNRGRFKPNQSGNPNGRPKARGRIDTLAAMDELIIDVGNRPIVVTNQGKEETVSLIEANIQALGHGKVAHRLAAKDTLELFRRALINRERRLSDAERLRQIEAANAERARRNGFMSDDD